MLFPLIVLHPFRADDDRLTEFDKYLAAETVAVNIVQATGGILGMGTSQGAPIPTGQQGFLKDNSGTIVVVGMQRGRLQQSAQAAGGRYSDVQLDNSDLEFLLPAPNLQLDVEHVLSE